MPPKVGTTHLFGQVGALTELNGIVMQAPLNSRLKQAHKSENLALPMSLYSMYAKRHAESLGAKYPHDSIAELPMHC